MIYTPQKLYRLLFKAALISTLFILLVAWIGIAKIYQIYVIESARRHAIQLAESFSAVASDLLLKEDSLGNIVVAAAPQDHALLDKRLVQLMAPFDVVKIKVFSDDATIVFSSESALIGIRDQDNPNLFSALTGISSSELERKDEISDLEEERRFDVDVVETYVPIYSPQQQIIGAFEIYQDMTNHRQAIRSGVTNSLVLLGLILTIAFCTTVLVVRRAAIALNQAQERLHHLATQDMLTGIFNRREIMHCIENEAIRLNRRHQQDNASVFSLIMGDIDKFKTINDTYGHQAGDQVLKQVAATMKDQLREYDRLGRYGGEEFVAMLPETNFHQAVHIAERMRTAVEKCRIETTGDLAVTVSFGVATMKAGDNDIEAVLNRADQALYLAKDRGRNKVAWLPDDGIQS